MSNRILLYTTMAVHGKPPYWGGSEKYWHDPVRDPRFRGAFECRVMLRESHATRRVAATLRPLGASIGWCRGGDGLLGRVRRYADRLRGKERPRGYATWYREIVGLRPDLVWFHLISINSVNELGYAIGLCRKLEIPYWLVRQHTFGRYFLYREEEREEFERVVVGASRVVCVSELNLRILEQAVGYRLPNVLAGTNAVPHDFLSRARAAA